MNFDTFEAYPMKKSRKHIVFSALLALLVLVVQTAFFPLHFYFTHHNTPLHAQIQYESDQQYQSKATDSLPASSLEDESCYWCDLFAHQGYFLEKFSDFIFQCPDINLTHPLACMHASLKADLPVSRGPPACMMV